MKEKLLIFYVGRKKYTKTDMSYAVKGSFWLLAGKARLFLISFATMVAFANWLPKESYGTYQFVIA